MGRAGLPVGEALRREVRQGRSRDVVLGDLERGRTSATGAARRRSSASCTTTRSTACAARCRRRASAARTRPAAAASSRATSSSTSCAARTSRPARSARRSTSSRSTPRAGRRSSTATCAWASPNQLATIDEGFAHHRVVPRAEAQADRHRRVRSRRLRRLPGPAARLPQHDDVFELHGGELRAQARPRRAARREPRRRAHLGLRVRGPAVLRRLPRAGRRTASTCRCSTSSACSARWAPSACRRRATAPPTRRDDEGRRPRASPTSARSPAATRSKRHACSPGTITTTTSPGPTPTVTLSLDGLGLKQRQGASCTHYRIDATTATPTPRGRSMGSPATPTPAQYKPLEAASQLAHARRRAGDVAVDRRPRDAADHAAAPGRVARRPRVVTCAGASRSSSARRSPSAISIGRRCRSRSRRSSRTSRSPTSSSRCCSRRS